MLKWTRNTAEKQLFKPECDRGKYRKENWLAFTVQKAHYYRLKSCVSNNNAEKRGFRAAIISTSSWWNIPASLFIQLSGHLECLWELLLETAPVGPYDFHEWNHGQKCGKWNLFEHGISCKWIYLDWGSVFGGARAMFLSGVATAWDHHTCQTLLHFSRPPERREETMKLVTFAVLRLTYINWYAVLQKT